MEVEWRNQWTFQPYNMIQSVLCILLVCKVNQTSISSYRYTQGLSHHIWINLCIDLDYFYKYSVENKVSSYQNFIYHLMLFILFAHGSCFHFLKLLLLNYRFCIQIYLELFLRKKYLQELQNPSLYLWLHILLQSFRTNFHILACLFT